jgi:4,5-dihydroxyphthalate decarboxylase
MVLRISLGIWDYDRVRPLIDGFVKAEGLEINWVLLPPSETIYRMLQFREYDVSEVSLSGFLLSHEKVDCPFVAIPVFPVRAFRHRSIYINTKSGIEVPEDLKGKVAGTPRYRQTASVWIRGMLSDEYGIKNESLSYVVGGTNQREREWKYWEENSQGPSWRKDVKIETMPSGRNLSDMLENGDIDVLYSASEPKSFLKGSKNVKRLFPDYETAERKYFEKTGIFPIMHVVVINKSLYEENRWIASTLFKAFSESKSKLYDEIYNPGGTAATKYILPWALPEIERTKRVMGDDFWPYGLDQNRKCLETFCRYSYEQGLAKKIFHAEDLFAHETIETFSQ